jgi:hypothetical protein
LRGKSSFLKDLRSNSDNWNKIEAKVLYLVQLWYDAFILEESVYNNIIDTYKILRKENVMFPPRSSNEKNIIFVKTESPILDNIEEIASIYWVIARRRSTKIRQEAWQYGFGGGFQED